MTTHSTKYIFAFCIYPYILFILFFLRPIDNNVRCDGLISLYRTISLEPACAWWILMYIIIIVVNAGFEC